MPVRRLKLLSANIQAGSSTRGYHDYVARSWSHVLPMGDKRGSLDTIARLAAGHDIVGLNESDPGSLRSGFTNQTHYLAQRGGFAYWSHQPNRRMGGLASSANGLLSKIEPRDVVNHALPGRIAGRGVLVARFGARDDSLTIAIAHLSLGASSRAAQLDFIADLLQGHPNAVLMGDFNCTVDQPEMQVLFQRTRLQAPAHRTPTFPSWRPQRAIDHILLSDSLAPVCCSAVAAAFSDHLALSVELDVPDACLA
ncbi:MAG: EEP domain-containing protein [Lysobacter sp.]|nr:MAG: EEP domain-containing protein [Lysobacter sp.]